MQRRIIRYQLFPSHPIQENMTEVAAPIDYQQQQQTTATRESTPNKDSKIYIHTGNIANWTNVKSRRSNDMPTNELNQALYRTLTKHRDQQLGDWDEVLLFSV